MDAPATRLDTIRHEQLGVLEFHEQERGELGEPLAEGSGLRLDINGPARRSEHALEDDGLPNGNDCYGIREPAGPQRGNVWPSLLGGVRRMENLQYMLVEMTRADGVLKRHEE